MDRLIRRVFRPRVLGAVVVVALLIGAGITYAATTSKDGVAYFTTAKNIYPKDRVRILGVDVGEITEITPEHGKVKISFSYDSDYTLPADVKAAIVSPTLVATRFMQLTPAYVGGPDFPDGGVIPEERTVSPMEFDDLKKEISKLATALGPNSLDENGSLSRFLEVAARNGEGRGAQFNATVRAASDAMHTLAEGREDLFGTIRNLQVFVTGLEAVDAQLVEFNGSLGSVSDTLDDNKDELAQATVAVDRAARKVTEFAAANKEPLTTTIDQAGQLTQTLAKERDNLATALHVGPSTLMNLFNIYSPRSHAFRGTLVVDNLNTPADLACTFIANSTAGSPAEKTKRCGEVLGPTLNVLRMHQPPVGVNPVITPGTPADNPGVPESDPPQPGPNSELPPPVSLPGFGGLMMPGGHR